MFTIAIRTRSNGEIHDQVGRFSGGAANALWDGLAVSEQQWVEWRDAVNSEKRHNPIVSDFPEISKLAYIDEGVVSLDPKQLHEDCISIPLRCEGRCYAAVDWRPSWRCAPGARSEECRSHCPPVRVGFAQAHVNWRLWKMTMGGASQRYEVRYCRFLDRNGLRLAVREGQIREVRLHPSSTPETSRSTAITRHRAPPCRGFFGEPTTVGRVYLGMFTHTHEHIGQAIAYARPWYSSPLA